MSDFGPAVLGIDVEAEIETIVEALRGQVAGLHRRGLVLGLSGGVDSAVCAALAVRAVGPGRVLALLMPDRDTPVEATERAATYAARLGIETAIEDIDPILEAAGCYRRRSAAIERAFPDLPTAYRAKIAIASGVLDSDRVPYFELVVDGGDGADVRRRMSYETYLEVVAATNMKQRTRKLVEYTHAEARNRAVLGTPNRLEYELGFFVRGGDGLADVKPIAHLYKTQVYLLADALEVDEAIRAATPSTDTYSLPQTQEEFFFGLPLQLTDLLLYGLDNHVPDGALAEGLGMSVDQVRRALREMGGKRRAAARGGAEALIVRPLPTVD